MAEEEANSFNDDDRPSSRNAGHSSRSSDCQVYPEIESISIAYIVNTQCTYQIDIDFGVSQRSVATVAPDNAFCGFNGCHLVDQLNAPVLIHITLGIDEAHIAVIILIEDLYRARDFVE